MQFASILLILLFSTIAATAQTRTVIAGKPFKLYEPFSINPDCSSRGDPVIRITAPPANGSISIGRGSVFPSYPASNILSACNRRRVPGTVATYVAKRGYSGPDSISLEVIYPSGATRSETFHLMVR